VEHDEQLAWEERAGRPAAIAAFAASILTFTGGIYLQVALSDREDGTDGFLAAVDSQQGDVLTAGVLQLVSTLILIPVLLYLYRVTRYRRSELTPTAAYLLVTGALTVGLITLFSRLQLIETAKDFFPFEIPDDLSGLTGDDYAEAVDPDKAAEEAVRDAVSPALQGLGLGGSVALAVATIMISINAMRAGLLSRFMGVLGAIAGALFVIPIGQQVLQPYWFGALGVLFLAKWPGGRGPAWQTGEAIDWPGAAAQREEIERRRAERDAAEGEVTADAVPRPASRKRRKKRG
jgi:hypothetical protein